jgi:RimJ/RimL family protein N-acetyltransferase
MLRPAYPLETARLRLRPFREEDFEVYASYRNLPEVLRYLYWDHRPEAEIREVVRTRTQATQIVKEGDYLALVVERKEDGAMIGDVVLSYKSEVHQNAEIGYCFHPAYHGHGYATEAARELLRLGFEGLNLHRISAHLDGRNEASARLLARLGMRKEAHLIENEWVKGEWTDDIVYAILDREWK